jgi:tetratricopeptide (TPR) repeat protein
MTTFKDHLDKANQSRKSGNFKEAIKHYKELWEKYNSRCNEWVAWGYALSLSKLKQNEKALEVCEQAYSRFPDFDNLKNVYAWALFNVKVSSKKIKDLHVILDSAQKILELTKEDAPYSPYTQTVLKVIEVLERNNQPAKILEWIDKIDLEKQPKDPVVVKVLENRVQTVPSKYEALLKTKIDALIKTKNTEEAAKIAQEYLSNTPTDKISSKTPFQYAIAHHYLKSGDLEQAYIWFKRFAFKKKKWQYHKELAEVFYKKGEYGDALKLACDACFFQGDYKKKMPLFVFMAAIFRKLNRIDLAKKHLELALAIRKELQFNLDNFSKNLIEEFEIDLNNLPDSKKIWAQLKNVWEKEQYSALPWYQGKIILVMNNVYCGFVGLDNGNTYYFKRDHFLGNSEYITTGQNVKFQIILAINPKKDKANKVAVNVTPLDENNEPYPFTENRKKDKPESENVSPNVINDLDLEMKTEKSENEN